MTDLLYQLSSPQDIYGYYTVGDLKTYSKLEAIEAETRTGHSVHWHFNDETFASYDWSIEPRESLNELYRQRAQQIRDDYDYIVLNYSSGSDSDNILTTFLNNNIKLDEILSMTNYDGIHSKETQHNKEIYHCVPERVQAAQTIQPHIKHRMMDTVQPTVDYFTETGIGVDYGYLSNGYLGPNQIAKIRARNKVPEWVKMRDAGKRVAFVWGSDKPFVRGINGKYYFFFRDMFGNTVTADQQINYQEGFVDELFYWHPKSAKMLIKQGHVVKNYLKSATTTTPYVEEISAKVMLENISNCVINAIGDKFYRINFDGVRAIIYPNWRDNHLTFKNIPTFISLRDEWIFNMPDDYFVKRILVNTYNGVWNNLPDKWKNDRKNQIKGIKHCNSQPYYLGE